MKRIENLAICLAMGLIATNTQAAIHETELSAAHGYVETIDGKVGVSGISIPGENRNANNRPENKRSLTNWTDPNACAVYYFHHPIATVSQKIKMNIKKSATVKFRLTVTNPNFPTSPVFTKEFKVEGTGSDADISIGDVKIKLPAYYRYKLECLSGNNNINSIRSFKFQSSNGEDSYAANYLSSPSVHLNGWSSTDPAAPKGANYDWCFMEIMIPESSDIVGTYAMSLGVLNGYMGIQMNGYTDDGSPRHDILFSMWDDGSTDEDPNLPEYLRAGAVDWDPKTTVNRFGNEGTGVQTYRKGPYWTPGRYVQFITNCRPETTSYTTIENGKEVEHVQHNMLVSAWFNALDGKGWQYMSTVRKRNSSEHFSSWYSFLENYSHPTGQAQRKAFYRNGYAKSRVDGKWYNFNKVGFGHTDGGTEDGARQDYGQGRTKDASERTFFMQTGGYTSTEQTSQSVTLATNNEPVDTINLEPLNNRIVEAIANEKKRVEEEEAFTSKILKKDGWKVIDKSSEETAGEAGGNGLAQLIVDGDYDTYWHPQWYGNQAQLPHHITVDMLETKRVGGFQINMGSDSNRYIKSYEIYGSNDNQTWTLLCSDENAPVKSSIRKILDKDADIRYFNLVIRETRANDGPFVRIYEVDVAGEMNHNTGISSIAASTTEGETKYYNIAGQRIDKPSNGLVIANGKKYVIGHHK